MPRVRETVDSRGHSETAIGVLDVVDRLPSRTVDPSSKRETEAGTRKRVREPTQSSSGAVDPYAVGLGAGASDS